MAHNPAPPILISFPEGGFGAVTDDGTTILNEETVRKAGLTPDQITYQAAQVRANIRQRSLLYHKDLPPPMVTDKTVIIVDDGLASGYTMMAAVESVRKRRPKEVLAAVPVASAIAFKEVGKRAKVVAHTVGTALKFYLADFYGYWNEPTDEEVLNCLREWRLRHTKPIVPPTARNTTKFGPLIPRTSMY